MSSIDQVIERSRAKHAPLTQRQQFTIARGRAIEKMRNFALADRHYFALELIQAAVANGAKYIDITSEPKFFALAYVGGGFSEQELAQLFDFLFADKSQMQYSALRQLALGVNALMHFEPSEIVVVSGDGTPEGTSQITIRGREDHVEVGRPAQPLEGTFVRAAGLKRPSTSFDGPGGPECRHILDRCLAMPVPVLVNNDPVFGYSSVRHPSLYGYERVIKIDEGDLYGTLGFAYVENNNKIFKLLTYGVLAQSFDHTLIPHHILGGVITFDRLNKTADHAAIVKDERLAELWARLLPYAQQLVEGKTTAAQYNIMTMTGERLSALRLREILQAYDQLVVLDPQWSIDSEQCRRAVEIATLLDAQLLLVPPGELETLRSLAHGHAALLEPELNSDDDLRFYQRPPIEAPRRPWMQEPHTLTPISAATLTRELFETGYWGRLALERAALVELLGFKLTDGEPEQAQPPARGQDSPSSRAGDVAYFDRLLGQVSCKLYSPARFEGGADEIEVRLISSDRLVWRGWVTCAHPGFVLDVTIDGLLPRHCDALAPYPPPHQRELSLGQLLAQVIASHITPALEATSQRTLDGLLPDDIEPGSMAAQRVLSVIAQHSLLRIRKLEPDAAPEVSLMMLRPLAIDVLSAPVFKTLTGEPVSLRQVVSWMPSTRGLIYGVVEGVEPVLNDLNLSRILSLSAYEEQQLVAIFGESAYVRVDKREFLATHVEPLAHVRDVAIGLKAYPQDIEGLDLLIEHAAPETWSPQAREQIILDLVRQLKALAFGPRQEKAATTSVDEDRRQAIRHLQYFCVNRLLLSQGGDSAGVEELPLFVDAQGWPMTFIELLTLAQSQGLLMLEGRAHDKALLMANDRRWKDYRRERPSAELAMSPYLFYLLRDHLSIDSYGFDLTEQEAKQIAATPEQPYLIDVTIDEETISGRIGVPATKPDRYAVLVRAGRGEVRALDGAAQRFGVVGALTLSPQSGSALDAEAIEQLISTHAQALLSQLLERLATWSPQSQQWRVAVETLLHYAAEQLTLQRLPHGQVIGRAFGALAQQVLELPLFDTAHGMPVSAQRLIDELCCFVEPHQQEAFVWRTPLSPQLPEFMRQWIDVTLHPLSIFAAPSQGARHTPAFVSSSRHEMTPQELALADMLLRAFASLRPDEDRPLGQIIFLDPVQASRAPLAGRWGQYAEGDHPAMVYESVGQSHTLMLNRAHPVVQGWLSQALHDPYELAWALLSIYALINERRGEVTNAHELEFQRLLWQALERGERFA